jgi:hypothetical protein
MCPEFSPEHSWISKDALSKNNVTAREKIFSQPKIHIYFLLYKFGEILQCTNVGHLCDIVERNWVFNSSPWGIKNELEGSWWVNKYKKLL